MEQIAAVDRIVLGVDGGGTKTVARLMAQGPAGEPRLIGAGHAAGSNPYSVGWESAETEIARATAAAMAEARSVLRESDTLDAAVLAIAGCATPASRDRLALWAGERRLAERVAVVPDTEPILVDAPAGEPAIGLIAGTGSSVLARSADGSTQTVGGWGYLIDDAGSGYALGKEALRHTARAADASRGEPTDLLSLAVLEAAGVDQAAGLKPLLYQSDDARAWTATLAPAVMRLARDGDADATAIIGRGADALARLALDAAGRVQGPNDPRPWAYFAGGLLSEGSLVRQQLEERLRSSGWTDDRMRAAPDAAAACATLALRGL